MEQAMQDALQSYVRSFNDLDLDRLVSSFGDPCLFVSSQFVAVADAERIRSFMAGQIEQATAENFDHSEVHNLHPHVLSPALGIVTAEVARYDTSGKELTRFLTAYTFRCDGDRWLIVSAAAGDRPDAAWTLES